MILFSCKSTEPKTIYRENELKFIDPKIVKYKSDETNDLILNFNNLTYSYKEKYSPKAGEDVGYENDSRGSFSIKNDTITFLSDMPSKIDVNVNWHTNTEFLQLYPTNEQIEGNTVKIYFDNIAEPKYYSAFEFKNGEFEQLKIKEIKFGENLGTIKTERETISLSQYLLIEKPESNKLVIVDNKNKSNSYFFDLDKFSFRSFHFYTRAYWSYYDFTGLKFANSNDSIKLTDDNRLNRYEHSIIRKVFLRQ